MNPECLQRVVPVRFPADARGERLSKVATANDTEASRDRDRDKARSRSVDSVSRSEIIARY